MALTPEKFRNLIDSMIKPLRNRVYMIVSRAVLEVANDLTGLQTLKMQILAGESRTEIERFQNYGFTSTPLPFAEAMIVCPQGNRDNMICIAVDDRRYRKKTLPGESAQYDDVGNFVYLSKLSAHIKHLVQADIDAPFVNLGVGATEPLIKGLTYQAIYNAHSHIGNSGYNTGTPIVPLTGTELSTVSKTL